MKAPSLWPESYRERTGYDTSNVANIQVPIYQTFGHIEILPWITLTFSLTSVAVIPVIRKLTSFLNLKHVGLVSCLLVCSGSAIAGAAPNIQSVIVGRAFLGVSSAALYQV